jgi:DNA primase
MNVSTLKQAIPSAQFYHNSLPQMPARVITQGWVDGGLCPFHDDHRKGNFRVNLSSGGFRCFSCGAHGGDIIAYIMLRDSLEFREALRYLAHEWGVSV